MADGQDQTLADFIAEEKARLDKFHAWWHVQRQQEPDSYPLEMSPGDWWEQLQIYGWPD